MKLNFLKLFFQFFKKWIMQNLRMKKKYSLKVYLFVSSFQKDAFVSPSVFRSDCWCVSIVSPWVARHTQKATVPYGFLYENKTKKNCPLPLVLKILLPAEKPEADCCSSLLSQFHSLGRLPIVTQKMFIISKVMYYPLIAHQVPYKLSFNKTCVCAVLYWIIFNWKYRR